MFIFLHREARQQNAAMAKGYEEHQNITEGGCFEIQPPGSLSETGVPCPCGCWCQVACQAQWYYSILKYNPLTAEYHHEEAAVFLHKM
jgi:hypothetical protein